MDESYLWHRTPDTGEFASTHPYLYVRIETPYKHMAEPSEYRLDSSSPPLPWHPRRLWPQPSPSNYFSKYYISLYEGFAFRYPAEEEARTCYGPSYRLRVSGTQKDEIRRGTGIGLKVVGKW